MKRVRHALAAPVRRGTAGVGLTCRSLKKYAPAGATINGSRHKTRKTRRAGAKLCRE
jgi:hypothetical protein